MGSFPSGKQVSHRVIAERQNGGGRLTQKHTQADTGITETETHVTKLPMKDMETETETEKTASSEI